MANQADPKVGYVSNIEEESLQNENFRAVLFTGKHSQLVVMSLEPGEEIGEEVHDVDQFIRVEAGSGNFVLNGQEFAASDGFAVVVPAGVRHNVVNTSEVKMKLYTIYSPAQHEDGTIHVAKADAMAAEAEEHGETDLGPEAEAEPEGETSKPEKAAEAAEVAGM